MNTRKKNRWIKPIQPLFDFLDQFEGKVDLNKVNGILTSIENHLSSLMRYNISDKSKIEQYAFIYNCAKEKFDVESTNFKHRKFDNRRIVFETTTTVLEMIMSCLTEFVGQSKDLRSDENVSAIKLISNCIRQIYYQYKILGFTYAAYISQGICKSNDIGNNEAGVIVCANAFVKLCDLSYQFNSSIVSRYRELEQYVVSCEELAYFAATSKVLLEVRDSIYENKVFDFGAPSISTETDLSFPSRVIRMVEHDVADIRSCFEMLTCNSETFMSFNFMGLIKGGLTLDEFLGHLKSIVKNNKINNHPVEIQKKYFATLLRIIFKYVISQSNEDNEVHLTLDKMKAIVNIVCLVSELYHEDQYNWFEQISLKIHLVLLSCYASQIESACNEAELTQDSEIKSTRTDTRSPEPTLQATSKKPKRSTASKNEKTIEETFNKGLILNNEAIMQVYSRLETLLGDSAESPQIYIRGGMLRSIVMGKQWKDIDIIVRSELLPILSKLENDFDCEYRFSSYPVVVVTIDDEVIEISSFTEDIATLAGRCDATVNSMFWNRHHGLIEFNDAIKDIKILLVKSPNPTVNLFNDPHQITRLIKLLHRDDFKFMAKDTKKAIKRFAANKKDQQQAYTPTRTFYVVSDLFLFGKAKEVFNSFVKLNMLAYFLPFCSGFSQCDKIMINDVLAKFDKMDHDDPLASIPVFLAILMCIPILNKTSTTLDPDLIASKTKVAVSQVSQHLFFPRPSEPSLNLLAANIECGLTHLEIGGINLQ